MPLPSRPTAFVTGTTGFVGSHLVEALLRRGYAVRCLVYDAPEWTDDPDWLASLPVTCFHGSVFDDALLRRAAAGADVVFHLAGVTQAPSRKAFYRTNVQGTLNVLAAAAEAAPSLHRVLITSSLAAVGRVDAEPAAEDTPLQPVSAYGKSKAAMERALQRTPSPSRPFSDRLPLTVVRPSSVYGPRDPDSVAFHQIVKRGVCPVPPTPSTTLSIVSVHDLVDGLIAAAESEAAAGKTYMLGSRRPHSWAELVNVIADALGRPSPRLLRIPPPLLYLAGTLADAYGRVTGNLPEFGREKVREVLHACKTCSSRKAQRDFDYRPATPLADGLARTVAWYREAGWL